jgi:hypothetical protein
MRGSSLGNFIRSCSRALGIGFVAAAGALLPASGASAQIFQDNALEIRYGTTFKEPFVGAGGNGDVRKTILNFTHVDGDKWGSDFFTADFLFSSLPDFSAGSPTQGAQEIYALYRRTFSYNKITGSKGGWGPIADFGIQVGGDANVKNDPFGSEKRLLVGGAYLSWAVPKGFLNTAFEVCHEWNQNGAVGVPTDFNTTFCFEAAWSFPIIIHGATFKFNGFFNIVAPKGDGGIPGNDTKTEILTRPEIVMDVGEFVFHRKNFIELGFAYEYWLNKFGNNHDVVPGALANTPMFVGRVHF